METYWLHVWSKLGADGCLATWSGQDTEADALYYDEYRVTMLFIGLKTVRSLETHQG